jgi:hypothetical protein
MDEVLSLTDLHDIVLPEGPPIWPPAAGFWVLIFLLVVLLVSAWRQYRSMQRRNAYRQAGLLLLKEAVSVHDVSVILKRVALAAWPREQVASLHGCEWVQFLNSHCRGRRFDEDALESAEAADQALVKSAAHWIRRHRAGKEAADG